jgi:ATP-dependent DNA helicase RecQ
LNHVVEVLRGAKTKGILDRGHDGLPTYGIGADKSADEWKHLAGELIRLGYASRSADAYATVDLTAEGLDLLKSRREVRVRLAPRIEKARVDRKRRKVAEEFAYDEALFDQLRKLRRDIADHRDVPAYVIFSDVSLRHMARHYPDTDLAFEATPGVGRKKAVEFARRFLGLIRDYVRENGQQVFKE